jgi:hypothetical protein
MVTVTAADSLAQARAQAGSAELASAVTPTRQVRPRALNGLQVAAGCKFPEASTQAARAKFPVQVSETLELE